jgi:peptidoglycan LD-endopeptidase LytH
VKRQRAKVKNSLKVQSHSVMDLPDKYEIFEFTSGYDPVEMAEFVNRGGWGVGGYNEKRGNMYLAPQYKSRRNIHMGIDIWAPAGEPVYAVLNGEVVYTANHAQEGNYGGTIVLRHKIEGEEIFALHGHLSVNSLERSKEGHEVKAGDIIGWLGDASENGNWPPHLHYQLSRKDPGEADMPGVVSEKERSEALKIYPDPRTVLGSIY